MNRSLALLSSAALFAASATAQCLTATGTSVVPLMSPTSTYPVEDEGRTSDILLPFTFAIAGTNYTHVVIGSNGGIYFTDGTGALGASSFGISSLGEMAGPAGGSPRLCAFGGDLQGVAGLAGWDILADDSVAGEFKVTWTGMRFYAGSQNFSMSATLTSGGAVTFSYAGNFGSPGAANYTGISAGNAVAGGVSSDLSAGGDTGAVEICFQNSWGWDLVNTSITIAPNGTGGFAFAQSCQLTPASHTAYGAGCYGIARSSNYQVFPDSPTAKAAMDGNAILYTRTATGYDASWVAGGGAAYVAPTGAAVTLITAVDDGNQVFTPSSPIPVPGGVATDLNIAANGILTMAATANHPTDWTPTAGEMLSAPELAFYLWRDFNTNEAGSGPIVSEEVGTMLYVTFDAVEAYGSPSPNPATFQWQIDMSSGNVLLCVVSMEGSTSTDDTLIGCSLAGTGLDSGSVDLATALPLSIAPDIDALALSAGPNPVSTPSAGTTVTYTMSNVPDANVNSGIRIAATIISFTQDVPGTDLGIIGAPGCNLHIGSLDLILSTIDVANNSTLAVTFDIPANVPAGVEIYAQAAALVVPGSLPNGQNAFGATTSNGIASYISAL